MSRRFLETVVDEKKESLKRYISAQLQDQRLQIKKEKSARGDESVEQSLLSCKEHRNICLRIFKAFIELTAEVGRLEMRAIIIHSIFHRRLHTV